MGSKREHRRGSQNQQDSLVNKLGSLITVAIVVICLFVYLGWTNQQTSSSSNSGGVSRSAIGFTSKGSLNDHFRKHGHEVGAATVGDYERMAIQLRDKPRDSSILEETRYDGVTTRLDKVGGGFVAYNQDRTIRTYFRPNDGERYFYRQLKR